MAPQVCKIRLSMRYRRHPCEVQAGVPGRLLSSRSCTAAGPVLLGWRAFRRRSRIFLHPADIVPTRRVGYGGGRLMIRLGVLSRYFTALCVHGGRRKLTILWERVGVVDSKGEQKWFMSHCRCDEVACANQPSGPSTKTSMLAMLVALSIAGNAQERRSSVRSRDLGSLEEECRLLLSVCSFNTPTM